MDSNTNHGSSREEKQMNVGAKASPIAARMLLGLALTAEDEVSRRQIVAASAGDERGGRQ